MPKFKKQVRNFLNNSPFKMKGKSTLLKASKGNMVSPLKEDKENKKTNVYGTPEERAESQGRQDKKLKELGNYFETPYLTPRSYKDESGRSTSSLRDIPDKAASEKSKTGKTEGSGAATNSTSSQNLKRQNDIKGLSKMSKDQIEAVKKLQNKSSGSNKKAESSSGKLPTYKQAWEKLSDAAKKKYGTQAEFTKQAKAYNNRGKTEAKTETQRRAPGVGYSGPGGGNSGNTIRLKKEVGPTGERVATKPPEKIASAEAIRTIEANRKILQNAKGQEKNMQDKNKLKADIKTLRKNKKGYTTGKGDTKSNKDLLNEKRQAKRKKGKAIREYKRDPNALKIDKVKKSSAAKMYKKKK